MKKELSVFIQNPTTNILLCGSAGLGILEDALEASAALLNCAEDNLDSHPDFLRIGAEGGASIGVDSSEEILKKTMYKPAIADYTVVLIERMELMTEQAQNKLLKLLEESQQLKVLALCYKTASILPTIQSRMRIIEYSPMDEMEFTTFCKENELSFSKTRFYATGGCPYLPVDDKLIQIFKAVSDCILNGQVAEILGVLHLAEEKDKENFCITYPDFVKNLLSMIAQLYNELIIKENGSERIQNYQMVLNIVEEEIYRCGSLTYSKDNFFYTIASIINALS